MVMNTQPQPKRVGESAVVIGASMAGLCAACVLADRFEHVTVLDRDHLPEHSTWRQQVPQGRHPHLLLAAGARLLEDWCPGIIDELYAGGAVELDLTADLYWHQGGGVARRPTSSLAGPSMSRPFLEWTIRQRLASHPAITIRGDTAVEGLELDPTRHPRRRRATRGRRSGPLRPRRRRHRTPGPQPELARRARLPRTQGGPRRGRHPLPHPGAATDRAATARDWKMAGVIDDPAAKRLAMALPIEGDRWLVVFGGVHGETAPADDSQRLTYAKTLPSPVIADILEASEPLSEPVTHRFPSSQRRHVERLKRFPLGWVPLGDAIGSFNPIYGQGMTSAAKQAAALGHALDRSGAADRPFARRYFKAASRVVQHRVVDGGRQRLHLHRHDRTEATRHRPRQPVHGQGHRRRTTRRHHRPAIQRSRRHGPQT